MFYPRLKLPLKTVTVGDSSHASRQSSYAQEGVLIVLMHDKELKVVTSDSPHYKKILQS